MATIPFESLYEHFSINTTAFSGTLNELNYALRNGRVLASEVNVLELVHNYLQYYKRLANYDMNLATETLPQLARVIELKARFLLPKPPQETNEEELLEETIEAVESLEALEEAIHFLLRRRDDRKVIVAAKTPKPNYPRPERALNIGIKKLTELASRYQTTNYFELARERLSMRGAIEKLSALLKKVRRGFLKELVPTDWPTLIVYFGGMLELVKEDILKAQQDEAYGEISLFLED